MHGLILFLSASTSAIAWILVANHGTPLHVAMAILATACGCLVAIAISGRGEHRPLDHEQMRSALSREIFRARRYERPFAALLLDLTGTAEAATALAEELRSMIRKTDDVGFWAEHRLMLVLSESSAGDASALADRIEKELGSQARFAFTEYRQDDSIQTLVQRLEASLEPASTKVGAPTLAG